MNISQRTTCARMIGIAILGAVTALTGCAAASSATPDTDISPAAAASSLSVVDPWAKSMQTGATSVFGVFANESAQDAVIVSAFSDAAETVELHETVLDESGSTVMRPVSEDLIVPAGGELVFEPGGHHLMLMGLVQPLKPGDVVSVALVLSDGSEFVFDTMVKDYTGAQETYQGEQMDIGDESDHSDMDHEQED